MLISVVTINYNNAEGLRKTIQSVLNQDYPHLQYIVIDGNSTDGSLAAIKEAESKISFWVSEPDSGLYHAMNKGVEKVKGEYVLFLNSGDWFERKDSLSTLVSYCEGQDFVYGNQVIENEESSWVKYYPHQLSFSFFIRDALPHASTLIKAALFEKYGKYNENFYIVSDWEFFLLCICKHNCTYKHIEQPVSVFNIYGRSSLPENRWTLEGEKQAVLEKHFATFLPDYSDWEKKLNQDESIKVNLKRAAKLSLSRAERLLKKIK